MFKNNEKATLLFHDYNWLTLSLHNGWGFGYVPLERPDAVISSATNRTGQLPGCRNMNNNDYISVCHSKKTLA